MTVLPKPRSKEAADAGEPLKFNYTRDNLPVALVPFAMLIVSFLSSFCSLGFALRATYGVLSFNNSFSSGKGAIPIAGDHRM